MLDDLQQEPVDYVITYQLDRLTRDPAEARRIHAAIRHAGAKLVCVADKSHCFPADLLFQHPAARTLLVRRAS